jgi:hypothetical protein
VLALHTWAELRAHRPESGFEGAQRFVVIE